jgi:site-specific recombinase XerD
MKQSIATAVRKTTLDIEKLIGLYELSNRADGKRETTIRGYNDILRLFIRFLDSRMYGNDLSVFNINTARDYILYLRNKPKYEGHPFTPTQKTTLSSETLRDHIRALRAFSTWLYQEGYTPENRLGNLKLPRAAQRMIDPLNNEEIILITNSINKETPTGYRNYAIVTTALDSGLRASELAGIKLSKLSLQNGYIRVIGKGNKERVVPIGKSVSTTLWRYIDKFRPRPRDPECDYLFLSRDGKPITVNTIKLVFTRLAKKSGVTRLHCHLCRHSFAINYLMNGGDIFSLREILGHTTLDMVNHYLHFTSSQIMERHRKFSPMDKLLNPA